MWFRSVSQVRCGITCYTITKRAVSTNTGTHAGSTDTNCHSAYGWWLEPSRARGFSRIRRRKTTTNDLNEVVTHETIA